MKTIFAKIWERVLRPLHAIFLASALALASVGCAAQHSSPMDISATGAGSASQHSQGANASSAAESGSSAVDWIIGIVAVLGAVGVALAFGFLDGVTDDLEAAGEANRQSGT